jgi:glycosyltransferase involved in cell wall biosynthesis
MKGEFGKIYEDIDVLLVPLTNNKFNRCKSELKFIEAGFTNTAVISSKVIPYSNFGVNEEDCLFVKEATPQAWAKAIKKILREKDLFYKIRDINSLRVKYSRNLEDITKKRFEFLKKII